MQSTRTASNGLEQKIYSYGSLIDENDMIVNVRGQIDDEGLLNRDSKRFSDHIYLPHWREVILAFSDEEPFIDPTGVEFETITSYHVQAIKKANLRGITPATVLGLVLTKDN